MKFRPEIIERAVGAACDGMRWGADDCCQFVRSIVLDHGGIDVLAGTKDYDDEAKAKSLLIRGEGLLRMAMNQAASLGLQEVYAPFNHDVALVGIVATERGPALAINFNGRWMVRGKTGVVILDGSSAVIAWVVPDA